MPPDQQRAVTQIPRNAGHPLLDCCYSGAIRPGSKGDEGVHLKEKLSGRGRAILTASNAIEYAWEGEDVSGEGQPSLFTAAIVQGLQTGEADRDRDGAVSINDLYTHVREEVLAARRGQTPLMWALEVEGDLYVARNPYPPAVEPVALPRELQQVLDHPLPSVRLAAIEELARLARSNSSYTPAARKALEDLDGDDSRKVSFAARSVLESLQRPSDPSGETPDNQKTHDTGGSQPTKSKQDLAAWNKRAAELRQRQLMPAAPSATGSSVTQAQVFEVPKRRTIYSVDITNDGRWLATGSSDMVARLWDARSGQELHQLRHASPVRNVVFSPDGRQLATFSDGVTAWVWDNSSAKNCTGSATLAQARCETYCSAQMGARSSLLPSSPTSQCRCGIVPAAKCCTG
jgi:WD40 repeat protein